MTKYCFPQLSSPKSVLRLCIVVFGLGASFPVVTDAARPGGGTTTTMVLTYTYGAPARWVMRVDPPAGPGAELKITEYKLSLSYDSNKMTFQSVAEKFPFSAMLVTPPAGGVVNVTGSTGNQISSKDVDIFELAFMSTVVNALAAVFVENFDSVVAPALPPGWSSGASGAEIPWVTSIVTPFSMPNEAFAPDPDNIGETQLSSPTFSVTVPGTMVTFKNNYITESDYDGMVLEISINGGPYSDILAAGGSFVSGGYNETISMDYGSPIAGRQAWSGKSGGYINSTVNLPPAASGQNVQLRWRMVTDNSVAGTGVRIDDVAQVTPQPSFTVAANPLTNDFLDAVDPLNPGQVFHFDAAQIAPTTRVFTPGVLPHMWDPNAVYNDGIIGGAGNWNQTSNSWDDLVVDTTWKNATYATDFAVFGGDPGSGIVTVTEPISVGGLQFDISGYSIVGGPLALPILLPALAKIDTNDNTATISSSISGGGFTKVGSGTLTLAGPNTYSGSTIISAGTLLLNNTAGSGTGNSIVTVTGAGSVLGGTGQIGGGPLTVNSGAAVLGGDGATASGALTIANNVALDPGSIILIVLGPPGSHSTLHRGGGTWSFDTNQGITFLNLGAQPGFYDNIITGLASDPGVGSWTINNPGFSGTLSYDGANIDLNLTGVPPSFTLLNARSTKTHGGAGIFNVPLPLSSPFGVECRSGGAGGNHTLAFTFTNPVVSGSATVVTMGTGSVSGSPMFFGNTMTVNLTGVGNAQRVTVTLSAVTDNFAQVLPDTAVTMRVLVGDTSGNGTVSGTDIAQTKLQAGAPVTNSNFREDVTVNGSISGSDIATVKLSVGTAVPKPAP